MRRIALFMLVATLVVALTVATAMAAPGGKGKGKDKEKVTICHKGKTITVAKPALKGHLNHGDTKGECVTEPTTPTEPATTA